jgi:homocysteine S-methyltransferase
VPQELRSRLAQFSQVADQRKVALEYTANLVAQIAPMIDGLYIISPLNKWEIALEFVAQARQAGWQGSGRAKQHS